MRKNFAKNIATAAVCLAACVAMASTHIPQGTDVQLTFDQSLNSRTAHVGDRVQLEITHDVVVDGRTVLRQGTPVVATVEKIRKNERFGINANMKLYVHDVHGIPLAARIKGKDSGSRADHAAEIAGAGALVLGPIGLLGSYFVVGKPVKIHQGDHLDTMVSQDTDIR